MYGLQRDGDLAAARNCRQRHQDEVEEQLHPFFGRQGAAAVPDKLRLLVRQERRGHRLGIAGVDLQALAEPRRAEGDAGNCRRAEAFLALCRMRFMASWPAPPSSAVQARC